MPQTKCRSSFDEIDATPSEMRRAERVDLASPFCKCQGVSVSAFSPGRVEDDEYLIRLLVPPQHVNVKKRIAKHAALTDAERCGLSVFREKTATNQEIRNAAEALVERARVRGNNPKAGIYGVLRIRCADVRTFRMHDEDTAAYCVYDTANEKEPSHGEIFQRVAGVDEVTADLRRKDLFEVIKLGFVPLEDFRNGFLLDLQYES